METQSTQLYIPGKKKLIQAVFLSGLFFIIEFILVHFHEMWSDEVHSWGIAASSHSFSQLIYNTRYEGHPELWYIVLFTLQLFTHNIFYMQVLHVLIAAGTVFVFCFFSPFHILKTTLICFGYFFAYEYSIISRNYGIEMLLLFLCAGLYTAYGNKYLTVISFLFMLLFETNVYAVIIGVPLYCYIIWSFISTHSLKLKQALLSGIIVAAGVVLSVIAMKPPADSIFNFWSTKITLVDLEHVLSTIYTAYIPTPNLGMHFLGN